MRDRARRARLPPAPRCCDGAATGRVATALFLRTYARGERVHLAMARARLAPASRRARRAPPLAPRRRRVLRRARPRGAAACASLEVAA